jgi:hypothetical protein
MSARDNLGKQFEPVIRHDPSGLSKRMVVAHHPDSDRPIGSLSWFTADATTPPKVYNAFVQESYRRKGVASSLFDAARTIEPDLQHSHALSQDGEAFAAHTPTTVPPRQVQIHGPAEPKPKCAWCGSTRAVQVHQTSRMDEPAHLCTKCRGNAA